MKRGQKGRELGQESGARLSGARVSKLNGRQARTDFDLFVELDKLASAFKD